MLTVKDPRAFGALGSRGENLQKPTGAVTFRRGEEDHGVYLVLSGSVATNLQDEPPRVRRTVSTGGILGVPASLDAAQGYSMTATVTKPAELVHVSRHQLLELMRNDPIVSI